jgi:hypothetical protein
VGTVKLCSAPVKPYVQLTVAPVWLHPAGSAAEAAGAAASALAGSIPVAAVATMTARRTHRER